MWGIFGDMCNISTLSRYTPCFSDEFNFQGVIDTAKIFFMCGGRRSPRAARAAHSPPPPGPPPPFPDLPPPEARRRVRKAAVGTFFFLPVRGGSEREISAGVGDAQAGGRGCRSGLAGDGSGVPLPGSPMAVLAVAVSPWKGAGRGEEHGRRQLRGGDSSSPAQLYSRGSSS